MLPIVTCFFGLFFLPVLLFVFKIVLFGAGVFCVEVSRVTVVLLCSSCVLVVFVALVATFLF